MVGPPGPVLYRSSRVMPPLVQAAVSDTRTPLTLKVTVVPLVPGTWNRLV